MNCISSIGITDAERESERETLDAHGKVLLVMMMLVVVVAAA